MIAYREKNRNVDLSMLKEQIAASKQEGSCVFTATSMQIVAFENGLLAKVWRETIRRAVIIAGPLISSERLKRKGSKNIGVGRTHPRSVFNVPENGVFSLARSLVLSLNGDPFFFFHPLKPFSKKTKEKKISHRWHLMKR
ncbi:hypothetical protein CEXT_88891 [Caerostris extrusa]|uniref:Uncharacterized protein n=1 Tax=Caerostris extrusa TaxID=172846 RepID=A0AAV4YDS0_CAEEX|nr:hypothetical protein CEXT_88891 [Caerostris extrusa]